MQIDCPVCRAGVDANAKETIAYPSTAGGSAQIAKPQHICFCPQCRLGIAYPKLSDDLLNQYYVQGDYWKNAKIKVFKAHEEPGLYALAQSRWEYIQQYRKSSGEPIAILDVGGGHGFIGMVAVKDPKVTCTEYCVIEKDKFFCESLKKTWGSKHGHIQLRVQDSFDGLKAVYDVIVISHVLEHLNDPKALLAQASRLLKPNGCIFIEVPHEDFRFKADVFPHLIFFNEASMRKMVEDGGLRVVNTGVYGKDARHSPVSAANSRQPLVVAVGNLYKLRHIIPSSVSVPFFVNYYGTKISSPQGTWLRVLAQQKDGV